MPLTTALLNTTAPRRPFAFSYIRMSTLGQKDGDSLRRQEELRDAWIARTGIPLHETFADIGVSGHKGKHRRTGALSRFLDGIKQSEVIGGDYLLIEDMDRLTREPVSDALKLVISILEAGVVIEVLNSGWWITLENFNRDPSHVFMLAAAISRANAESRRKSEMVTKAAAARRVRAREYGVPFTTQGPPWCAFVDGRFVLNEKVEVVRQIFEWAAAGLGSYSITRRLKNTPSLTGRGRWRDGTVAKLLHNRSVLGWYQPCRRPKDGEEVPEGEPIKLYPEAIDAALFQRVQDATRPRMGKPLRGAGRMGFGVPNLFKKLASCAHCGWPMHLKPVAPKNGKRREYLYCSGKAGHICDVPRNFSYPQVEAAILRNVSELDFHSLLSDESEKVKIDAAERRAAELHERHEAVNRGIETLYTQLEKFETEMAANLTTKRIDRKSTELAAVQAELEVARTELEALRRGAACRARGPATIERLILELETAQGEAKHVLRSKLSSVLKSVITEMRFDGRNRTVDVQIFDKSKIYRFKQGELEWQEIVSRIGYATAEEVEGWVQVYQADYNVPQEARVIRETDTGVIMRVRDKEVAAEFTTMTKLVLHRFQEPKGWQRRTKKPHPANANLGDNT